MPDIKGKKINQLDDGKAVVDPLFVLSDQDGKAYNLGAEDLKAKMAGVMGSATVLAQGTNLNTLITPGYYALDKTIFKAGGYFGSPFPVKTGIWVPEDLLLIVEALSANRVNQRIIWPIGRHTEVCRTVGTTADGPRPSYPHYGPWEIQVGMIQIDWCYSDAIGGYTDDSIQNLNDYVVAGLYEIIPWRLKADGSNTWYSPPKADALARNYPDIAKYRPNASYSGSAWLRVEYGIVNSVNTSNQALQRIYTQYGSSEPWLFSNFPYEFVRGFYNDPTVMGYGPWVPASALTQSILSTGANAAADNILAAGTATIPPIGFKPGVQVQNPVVKGALNYDGTDFYYTDNSGNKHKINSTIV